MRRLLALAAALLFAVAAPAAAANPEPPGNLSFQVFRGSSQIGTHRINFTRTGEDLIVDVGIDLAVRVAGIAVYRYTHRNREVWRGGRLVAINTTTDDDGDKVTVVGRATGAGFEVQVGGASTVLPATILPTSYWHPRTAEARQMLNTQGGDLLSFNIAAGGEEQIDTTKGKVPARRFGVTGGLDVDIWYDRAGRLARIAFKTKRDGSLIWYRRLD